MQSSLMHSLHNHFPWVVRHPTGSILLLSLYALYSSIASLDNAFKAQVVRRGADPDALNRVHDGVLLCGIPLALLFAASGLAYAFDFAAVLWLVIAPAAAVLMFIVIASSCALGRTGTRPRLLSLLFFLFSFSLGDLFMIFHRFDYVFYGVLASAVVAGIGYLVGRPVFVRISRIIDSHYITLLVLGALYPVLIIGTVFYGFGTWFWDIIQTHAAGVGVS